MVAREIMRSRPGMRRRYSSCSMMISFSTSWGVAPGHWVMTVTILTSRSGIIWMGTRKMASRPNRQMISTATAIISGFSMANLNILILSADDADYRR